MTDAVTPAPERARPRRRAPLYRTVLSIAVAALVAAWLPFSVFYVAAVRQHAAQTLTTSAAHSSATPGAPPAQAPAPVTTRTSAAAIP